MELQGRGEKLIRLLESSLIYELLCHYGSVQGHIVPIDRKQIEPLDRIQLKRRIEENEAAPVLRQMRDLYVAHNEANDVADACQETDLTYRTAGDLNGQDTAVA